MGQHSHPASQQAATWWTDESGVTHICEGDTPVDHELLIWTLCDREVESGSAFAPSRRDAVSCSKCAAAASVLHHRRTAERLRPATLP